MEKAGKFWRTAVAVLATFACLAIVVHGRQLWRQAPAVDVVFQMATTTHGKGQVFPLARNGYAEHRAVDFELISDGQPHRYAARLLGLAYPGAFRIDPGTGDGQVRIDAIQASSAERTLRLEAGALRRATRPLNQLTLETQTGALQFRSRGEDPNLEVTLPPEILGGYRTRRWHGMFEMLAGTTGLALLLLLARKRLAGLLPAGQPSPALRFGIAAIAGSMILLWLLHAGCDGLGSWRGLSYGAALILAALALGVVGAAVLQLLGFGTALERPRLFLWIAVGQLALILYVYLRSALHAVAGFLPLDGLELALPVGAAAVYLWRQGRGSLRRVGRRKATWWAIEFALLAVICVVVADRELPRVLMLSSDPDVHAFFARQLERLGGLPWFGEAQFNYPGGTAAMGFIWAKLSLLDVRNALTALPLLQSYLAALILGEALAVRARAPVDRLLLMLAVLGITAAGFLIPFYTNYYHMEGTGRQVAIAIAVIVPALLLADGRRAFAADRSLAILLLASLFVLAALNPISVVIPAVLSIAYIAYVAFACGRLSWWSAALLACPALLLLDPFYFHLLTGSAPPASKITISDAMRVKPVAEVLTAWWQHWPSQWWRFLAGSGPMGPGQSHPLFAIFLGSLLVLRILARRTMRMSVAVIFAICIAVAALATTNGLFAALHDDRRAYLLAPYYAFALGQLKILLVTLLAGSVLLIAITRRWSRWTVAVLAALMVAAVHVGMPLAQRFNFEPRFGYCGSLGCASTDDLRVMSRFQQMMERPGTDAFGSARVLVPNSVHHTRNEDWVFPVAGARALPFYDVPAVAFYYYQGDDDYTTANYEEHVCRRFDRLWLRRQGIGYVFLPSARDAACLEGMEYLPMSEQVLVKSGNSYLLRLR